MKSNQSEFDIAPIGDDQLVPWPRVAAVAAMVSFSLPTFITGLEVSQGLSLVNSAWALFWGSVIVFIVGAATGSVGSKTRLSSYLLVRVAFGDRGAGWVNVAFAISLLGWFGVNINIFTDAIARLSSDLWGVHFSEIGLAIFASVCMTTTTLVGFRAINLGATLMVPVLAFVTVLLAWSSFSAPDFSWMSDPAVTETSTIGAGISAVVGAIIIGAIILPDITRFVRHASGAVYTAFFGYIVIQLSVLVVASVAGGASGSTDILGIMLELNLGLGAFLIVIAGSWVLNSLNLYSAALSLKATFPAWQQTGLIIGLGIFGVAAALLNLLDSLITFLFYLSVIFIPVAGVLIIDAFYVRPHRYHIETLVNNRRYNPQGLIAWAVGAAIALLASEGVISALTQIAAIDAVLASGLLYFILTLGQRTQERGDS